MSINIKSLKTAIAAVIKTLSTKDVIWANQNSNTPDGEFLSLKISSTRFIGFSDWQGSPELQEDETFQVPTQGDREIVLSIQCISQNSMEILLDLVDKLNLNSHLELLASKKLAYIGMDGDIADITVQINNSFETRAAVDLVFRISKNYSSDSDNELGIIESVELSGELDGNGLEDPVEVDLTVEPAE